MRESKSSISFFKKRLGNGIVFPILIVGIASLFLRVFRLSSAPAIHGDEITYFSLAQSLLRYGALIHNGKPWFIHPPLYFLVLASFFKFVGIGELTFGTLLTARVVSATFSASTSIVLFVLGLKLLGRKAAIIISALYCVEPFLLLYGGRMGFIEPTAIFFSMLALLFYYKYRQNHKRKSYILSGIFVGLSLIVKEVTLFLFFIIASCVILDRYLLKRPTNFRHVALIFGIASSIYLLYAIWGFTISYNAFVSYKTRSILRALGFIQRRAYLTPSRPANALLADMLYTLDQYWATYLLIALSIPFAIHLFKRRRENDVFVLSWYLGTAIFFVSVFHLYNPQFFDFLLIPTIAIDGYVLSCFLANRNPRLSTHGAKFKSNFVPLCILTLLLVLILYNSSVWVKNYGVDDDTAFQQAISYIEVNIAKDAGICTHWSLARFVPDDYRVHIWTDHDSIQQIEEENLTYFIFSPRWRMANSEIVEQVKQEGEKVVSFPSRTLRSVDIYHIPLGSQTFETGNTGWS